MAKIKNKQGSWWNSNEKSSYSSSGSGYKSSFFDWDRFTTGFRSTWKPEKKKEIIKPYMNWYDEGRLERGVYDNRKFATEIAQKITGNNNVSGEAVTKASNLIKEIVPDHMLHDIYSMYFNKSENIVFEDLKDSNIVKFKLLEAVNNSLLKIVSNNNSIASFMYTKEIAQFLVDELLNQLTKEELEQLKNSMSNTNKEGDGETSKDDSSSGNGKGRKGTSEKNRGSGGKNKGSGSGSSSNETEGDSGEGDNDKSERESSSDKQGNQGTAENEEGGTDDGGDSNSNESDDGGSESDSERSSNPQSNSRGASKTGTSKNPLKGHNTKDNVDASKNRREQDTKLPTREENLANTIENAFSKPDVKERLEAAIKRADELMSDLEKAGIDLKSDGLSQIAELANMDNLKADIAKLNVNKSAIGEAIKHILDNSINYFSKKYTRKEIDLLDADEIDEIFGVEYLHPIFRGLMIDRLGTEERKYQGKIDLYIDISGSMSSNCGISGVSCLLFAKCIALAMFKMDLLNNLYTFDTRIYKVPVSEINILKIGCGGGTIIDNVVRHVVDHGKTNSICLTDGEDNVNIYDDRVFFLGTVGVLFRYFNNSVEGTKYIDQGQCINFDGNKTMKITKKMQRESARRDSW